MRLLIIGSLRGQLGAASKIAIDRGAKVSHAETIDEGLRSLRSGSGADLLMVDQDLDIAGLIRQLETEHFHLPVVACGLGADAQAAVAAIRAGAKEYIPLPPEPDLIAAVLEAVTEESQSFVYRDPAMADLVRFADQIANSEASVLITGESGTGKEVLARYIYRKSGRNEKPYVTVNCAAIPENLLESELFGHEKGAFTGAVAQRIGKFEEANGGTLLLDEISEMDKRLQAKLLRAIQEREIDRVGGSKPVPVNIRIIATSNRDLAAAVEAGDFREDLWFRLNVVNLHMPPLRDRPQDIAILADHFAKKYAEVNGVPLRPLTGEALALLTRHGWRGNVRELENAMHRAVLFANGEEIGAEAILLTGSRQSGSRNEAERPSVAAEAAARALSNQDLVGRTVADVERDLIIDTLHHCLGNRTHAANILGISIRTLRNKLKQYSGEGVPVPMPGEAGRVLS